MTCRALGPGLLHLILWLLLMNVKDWGVRNGTKAFAGRTVLHHYVWGHLGKIHFVTPHWADDTVLSHKASVSSVCLFLKLVFSSLKCLDVGGPGDAWAAQLVKRLPSTQIMILGSSPVLSPSLPVLQIKNEILKKQMSRHGGQCFVVVVVVLKILFIYS